MKRRRPRVIDPDDFLETADGRIWTVERNAAAWAQAYEKLETCLADPSFTGRVVIVCGVQGAGKTHWIAAQPASSGTVYFDAALPGARHRAPLVAIARRHGVSIDVVWIDTPLATALARNACRSPDKRVPTDAILSVAGQFEPPAGAEGFGRVDVVLPGAAPVNGRERDD